jgi:hypothetical protein
MAKGKNTKFFYNLIQFKTDRKDKLQIEELAKKNNVTVSKLYRKMTAYFIKNSDDIQIILDEN